MYVYNSWNKTSMDKLLNKVEQYHKDNLAILKQKNADYSGANNDPFKNFKACNLYGITTEQGLLVRMSDKMMRVSNLLTKDNEVKDESIKDTLKDLSNYALILLAYIEDNE